MIMKARYILFAVAALTLTACSKTNEQPEPDGIQMTFRAYQEGSPGTKTTVQNGGTQVYWEPADEIKVFFKGSGSRFISQNTAEATVADFSGTLNILIGANEGASSTTKIFGLYPYRADAVSDGSSVTTTLPAEQTGRAGSFAKNTHISLAATNANSVDLGFYNVTGGLRFSLTQEGIKSVTFEGNNGENLAGKIKLAFEGGIPVIKEVADGVAMLTLNAPGGGTFQTGQWYYIEAIPGTLSKGFKMVFSKGNESAKLSSSSSVTIGRGKYGSLADADEGLIFKESGSGDEPDPSSVIQFADPIAKYACVEKFDTNGDQEVSYAEAAAATSLDGLFTNWNTVSSFDEVKYFTGVKSTEGVFTGLSSLKSITIPEFIITLGTFQNCSSLESVTIPASITTLPSYCFYGCSALSSVTLPYDITAIPAYCFWGCTSLRDIEFPLKVKTISECAFLNCSSICSVDFPTGLTTIGAHAFQGCTSITTIIIPSTLTRIEDSTFSGCVSLNSVSIPEGITTIGSFAFDYCPIIDVETGYSLVSLPSSIEYIGDGAFYNVRHFIIRSNSFVTISGSPFPTSVCYIYVPDVLVTPYKARTNWSNYANCIYGLSSSPASIDSPVDLGLPSGKKWSACNLGANWPYERGDVYTWGEVTPGAGSTIGSHYYWLGQGVLNKYQLDLIDDAAYYNLGGLWRSPELEEYNELLSYCLAEACDGGIKFTSKANGNSIFIPGSGIDGICFWGKGLYYGSCTPNFFYRIVSGWTTPSIETSSGSSYGSGIYNYASYHFPIRPISIPDIELSEFSLDIDHLTLTIGGHYRLIASIAPSDATTGVLQWSSSNPSIAIVDEFQHVIGVSPGTATITATTYKGETATCAVNVIPDNPIPDKIDLGLPSGLKWASFNVGATNPAGIGVYYAWGEIAPKNDYSWSTYKWGTSETNLTKYNSSPSNGVIDNLVNLEAEDDPANVLYGGNWRTPTNDEMQELIDNCNWSIGNRYYTITSKTNGNSILIPISGYFEGTRFIPDEEWLWTSTVSFSFVQNYTGAEYGLRVRNRNRTLGQTIRAVCNE